MKIIIHHHPCGARILEYHLFKYVCKLLRRYLHWVQNSVFEGELSEGKLAELKFKLSLIIDPEVDSVIIYTLWGKWKGRGDMFQSLTGSIQTEVDPIKREQLVSFQSLTGIETKFLDTPPPFERVV